ncbi:MAG TPA: ribonuclease P protein component [Flavobacteriaceae bacterium]|nr:ribonuclease P protein component [Flavobacteriaceae bacterium]
MSNKLTKDERLRSKISIDALFKKGKGIIKYPIKMQYMSHDRPVHQVAFTAPKRNFKRAVDRNRIKRLMRETYRTNKHILSEKDIPAQAIFFIYIGKKMPTYANLEKRMKGCLKELSHKAKI